METTEPTNEDREQLRERVRALLDASNRSQKQLETELGWSSGTVSRVFGGRKPVDQPLLAALAAALGTDPAKLVEGTGYAALLDGAAAAPEPKADPAPVAPEPVAPPVAAEPEPPKPAKPPMVAEALLSVPEPAAAKPVAPPEPEPAPAPEPKTEPKAEPPKAAEAVRAPPSTPPPAPPPPAPAATPLPPPEPIHAAPPEAAGFMGRIKQWFSRIRGG